MQVGKIFLGCVLLLSSLPCIGGEPVRQLTTFLAEVQSLQGGFSQVVWDENDELVQKSSGTVALERPGRFRWQYLQPHRQLILADGQYLWVYDEELKQAVARPIKDALGSAPIMLLTNSSLLHEEFEVSTAISREGLSWVDLVPLVQDAEFRHVQIGLNEQGIQKMILYDQFSQKTAIEFTHLNLNVSFPSEYFIFKAPSDVDIVGYSVQ